MLYLLEKGYDNCE